MKQKGNAGFIAVRLAGTDGVSLESAKWENVLQAHGYTCFYLAGELDRPPERSRLVPEAHFTHPAVQDVYKGSFGRRVRSPATTALITTLKDRLKAQIRAFISEFDLDCLVIENALAIPMNLPFGLALTEVISETGITTIAHHHDFFWERQRFLTNCVWEYLNMAFPPHLPFVHHVVINSSADNQLSLRMGISATTIPNVMDFEHPSPESDDYAADVRQELGIADDELFLLQPTRVVQRKGIEHAIELVSRLGLAAKLVVSHASGDEGQAYEQRVRNYSAIMGVDTLFISDRIGEQRGRTANGDKIYTLADIYPHADLVTYPSTFEGFGNAFLEAVYYRKPLVVNNYSIYHYDIKPKGFDCIELDGYVTEEAVARTRKVLCDSGLRKQMTERNYELGRRHYSFSVLERKLTGLLEDCQSCRGACVCVAE